MWKPEDCDHFIKETEELAERLTQELRHRIGTLAGEIWNLRDEVEKLTELKEAYMRGYEDGTEDK